MLEFLKSSPIAAFIVAFAATLAITPLVKKLAWRCGVLARPDARRLHPEPIALWGGIAIFFGVTVAALLWRQPTWQDLRLLSSSGALQDIAAAQRLHLSTVFFGCGFLVLLLGIIDDHFELSPLGKLAGQTAIVCLLWYGGVRIRTLPFSFGLQELPEVASLALTLVWFLGLMNAMNLIDGADGLASGVCAIGSASLSLVLANTAGWAACASAAICGACIAFLRYNFHPARIFLGDAGSTLLGFWFAAIAVAASAKTAAATTLLLPLLVLGVPVADTAWAVVRRTLAGQPPWRADRGHLHHRLLARGYSTRQTVLLLYSISLVLGIVAILWGSRGG